MTRDDDIPLVLAQEAMTTSDLSPLASEQRAFLFRPLIHSESSVIHEKH